MLFHACSNTAQSYNITVALERKTFWICHCTFNVIWKTMLLHHSSSCLVIQISSWKNSHFSSAFFNCDQKSACIHSESCRNHSSTSDKFFSTYFVKCRTCCLTDSNEFLVITQVCWNERRMKIECLCSSFCKDRICQIHREVNIICWWADRHQLGDMIKEITEVMGLNCQALERSQCKGWRSHHNILGHARFEESCTNCTAGNTVMLRNLPSWCTTFLNQRSNSSLSWCKLFTRFTVSIRLPRHGVGCWLSRPKRGGRTLMRIALYFNYQE